MQQHHDGAELAACPAARQLTACSWKYQSGSAGHRIHMLAKQHAALNSCTAAEDGGQAKGGWAGCLPAELAGCCVYATGGMA